MPRRLAALTLILLLLHSVGLGAGVLHAGEHGDGHCAAMHDVAVPDAAIAGHDHGAPAPQGDTDPQPSCDLAGMPGCAAPGACAAHVVPGDATVRAGHARMHGAIIASTTPTPESRAVAPELPPPRT